MEEGRGKQPPLAVHPEIFRPEIRLPKKQKTPSLREEIFSWQGDFSDHEKISYKKDHNHPVNPVLSLCALLSAPDALRIASQAGRPSGNRNPDFLMIQCASSRVFREIPCFPCQNPYVCPSRLALSRLTPRGL
jgi:hypothetical protein